MEITNQTLARIILIILFILLLFLLTKNYKKISIPDKIFEIKSLKFAQERKNKKIIKNKMEEKCRVILEKIFNDKFPSCRPDFLKSPKTGKNLELDCYNESLKLALEYNGQQHYTYTPYFHRTKTNFYSQVHRDDWKRKKCKEFNITLIEIPYWIEEHKLEEYIKKQLTAKGVSF